MEKERAEVERCKAEFIEKFDKLKDSIDDFFKVVIAKIEFIKASLK